MNELKALNKKIPEGQSDVPILTPLEIEHLRGLAVTAAGIPCQWMIDTKLPAPGRCKCNLVECDNPESSIYRNNGEKPFRWKATLCNPNNCRFFIPKQ